VHPSSAWIATLLADGWDGIRNLPLAPVDVAILDSGIDGSHPDLAGRIVSAAAVELEDGKPVVHELSPDANNDAFGHGTSVAGIVAGIAPNARIHDLRVLNVQTLGAKEILLEGFRYALTQPWRLLNMSLAAVSSVRQELMELCERAYFQEQIIVAARRNVPLADDGLPASLSSCIGVDCGAFETPFQYFFRARTPVEFEARGDSVVVIARGGGYTTLTGTSFATPTMCALCALLLGAYPTLKLFEVKSILRELAYAKKNNED
jgi:subtilisin family serine protease